MKYALISVFDKTGIAGFAKTLIELKFKIIATGGTAKTLVENGIPIIPISNVTGNPESFDGRVKTMSFHVGAGILFDRSNPSHVQQARALHIKPIDIVVCNLYPFESKPSIETIDVGGPTMVRAAAKNYQHVLVVIDPKDYDRLTPLLRSNKLSNNIRQELAAKAFAHLSLYDALVTQFLEHERFPNELTLPGKKVTDLRYGENPHQQAALYTIPNTYSPFNHLTHLWGRELSLTNITDINAGLEVVRLFNEPTGVIIKHNSPCGIALGSSPKEALTRAIEADPQSAFGGVIVLNETVNRETAAVIAQFKDEQRGNIDILATPAVENKALALLRETRKSMGVYAFGKVKSPASQRGEQKSKVKNFDLKWIDGGFVMQTADADIEKGFKDWEIVTKKKPIKKQLEQMQIAWKFVSRIRSNAVIVVDRNLPMTRGIGSGQTSRVRSTKIALEQAGAHTKGGILASDSFFPFADSVNLAAKYGIGAIVQQGGSVNDESVIEAANKTGIAMVFTHRRAFWH